MKTLIFLGCKNKGRMYSRVFKYLHAIDEQDYIIVSGTKRETDFLIQTLRSYDVDSIIVVDDKSKSTYENMVFSFRLLITENVMICTDKFHIFRSTLLAIYINYKFFNSRFNILNKYEGIKRFKLKDCFRFLYNIKKGCD